MIGTDQPIPWNLDPIGHIMETQLTNKERVALMSGNAKRALGIKSI